MAIEKITMPQLGESVTEGTISKWLVSVGDKVNKYDPIAEVMTDKVNAEVPSSFTGVIKELIASEGETLPVGAVICTIEVEGEGSAPEAPAAEATQAEAPKTEAPASQAAAPAQAPKKPAGERGRYSPAVLRLAQEHNIDLEQVQGTGAGGRITRKDLLKLIESGNIPTPGQKPAAQAAAQPVQEAPQAEPAAAPKQQAAPSVPVQAGDVEIPVTPVRKAIAANMLRSKHEAPHAWTMVEVDVTNLVAYRDSMKNEFKKREGFNLTYFAFFVKAVAQALKEFPQINSMWAGDKIVQKKEINISIAVATDDALFVPVIKNADEKTIKGIAREISELAAKVRAGKLRPEDMQGGTFTVNNTGSFGSVQSMGIINYPQAAILQVEAIVKRPVVMNNGMIAVRDMVNLCLSLDHRVLDGLICGRFLARVKEILENTSKENTPIY
ncbi:dihydrolipoamide acetyltransferase family protein [Anoxybacillus rupiensis]|uniref:Dihydrolipoamide acetyltransferase component of pyruvate dehydrogenase complex n=1 Tax=Anoxybacteroides rupiense TaxID=311460 RepID=A0ABD5ITL8_9BACL|nr:MULTISPECIES: dihydrolipoamide acetyltransferase family protein [Anoxybacillus]KXG11196.1 Dihydrolipoyllysine-residue acetyltransferase component of pyruvate dehydrogenase complex [Anoxybacillus sp. P3H1B]MBB3906775.1 2-oxoisovalerate dehydrogenase E2 component (dihydrolipoyl transacylase) [Anoxybacillus rupiensis]MBS2770114.1 2-oxo acid dehydrogenase subunit E2 [Anoxybacillus rupiensis]MDE8562514.1 dihydrolipoamide acetyltransferase family protein [Anoxybacillus rupiensis]MED5050761.1 dihy